jgi:hypothetical protein
MVFCWAFCSATPHEDSDASPPRAQSGAVSTTASETASGAAEPDMQRRKSDADHAAGGRSRPDGYGRLCSVGTLDATACWLGWVRMVCIPERRAEWNLSACFSAIQAIVAVSPGGRFHGGFTCCVMMRHAVAGRGVAGRAVSRTEPSLWAHKKQLAWCAPSPSARPRRNGSATGLGSLCMHMYGSY